MRILTRTLLGLILLFYLFLTGLHFRAEAQRQKEDAYRATLRKTITVLSSSFPPDGDMPVKCSCRGSEASPALLWEDEESNAEYYVVTVTDYDVPTPMFSLFSFAHWVLYNLPASVRSLPEGLTDEQLRLLGGKAGKNSAGSASFIGPCPSAGRHAYVFRVYALDKPLTLTGVPTKSDVLDAMKGHILSYGELKGYFD